MPEDRLEALSRWVEKNVLPHSNAWEEKQELPPAVLKELADQGWFGASLPGEWGGLGLSSVPIGRASAYLAKGSVSLLSIFTVHTMVCQAVLRWGTPEQKKTWLPALASGHTLAAFALTEPNQGSDATSLECQARRTETGFLLQGAKKWISASRHAGLFLVMARCGEDGLGAFLTPADTQNLRLTPMRGLLGFRAAGIAELAFAGCPLPPEALLGSAGGGFTFVASHALDWGRFTVGWGAAGIIEACLEASVAYAGQRKQFGQPLRKHQLIQAMIADMATDLEAVKALALQAALQRDALSPDSIMSTTTAKYFGSRAALKAAADAVQIHGGNGCSPEYPVMRYFRDAKICEIIEGSSQMQQIMIASQAIARCRRGQRTKHE